MKIRGCRPKDRSRARLIFCQYQKKISTISRNRGCVGRFLRSVFEKSSDGLQDAFKRPWIEVFSLFLFLGDQPFIDKKVPESKEDFHMAMGICSNETIWRIINRLAIIRLPNDFHGGVSHVVMPCVRLYGQLSRSEVR